MPQVALSPSSTWLCGSLSAKNSQQHFFSFSASNKSKIITHSQTWAYDRLELGKHQNSTCLDKYGTSEFNIILALFPKEMIEKFTHLLFLFFAVYEDIQEKLFIQ